MVWNRIKATTPLLDTIQIWGGTITSVVLALLALIQGLGMAISLLIGLAAFPLAFVTILLIAHRDEFQRFVQNVLVAPQKTKQELFDGIYEGAHEELMLFVVQHLLPTCYFLESIQETIIKKTIEIRIIEEIAQYGILHAPRAHQFGNAYTKLSGMNSSPAEYIDFMTMIDCVDVMERTYTAFAEQANDIAISTKTEVSTDKDTKELFFDWLSAHEQMCSEYDKIKQNSRMGKLFRPVRISRWGVALGSSSITSPNQFLDQRGTAKETRQ